jgi:hypothetical protein
LGRVLTLLSFATLPVITLGFILTRFGMVERSTETLLTALAAGAGGILAVQAYRSMLEVRRLAAIDRRVKAAKPRMSPRARADRVDGRILLVIGFIVGPIAAVLAAFSLLGAGLGSPLTVFFPLAVLGLLASPICVGAGWMLAAGRKELVLFLRRFGSEALNDSVRDLIRTSLRARVRLVTLDDSAFIPLGPRWRSLASSAAPSGVLLGMIAFGYAPFAKVALSELNDETPFGESLAIMQLGIVIIGLLAGLTALSLFATALRAHFTGRRVVNDGPSRARLMRRLRNLRSLLRAPVMAAPMATVVTATDSEWQATVASMGRACNVTLIDISQPRENIRWELATLKEAGVRVLLLAQREALMGWWDNSDDHLAAQLRLLATGLPLVTYAAPDRLDETELVDRLCDAEVEGQGL